MKQSELDRRRQRMVDEVEQEYEETVRWTGRSAMSAAVRAALAELPRHRFVPGTMIDIAYVNHAMPIGHGQTISQPYIVAIMADLLDVDPSHRVLEIGTGSAYQAAVLCRLAGQVFTIETVAELAEEAKRRLAELGCGNVTVRLGDGWQGWPEEAPFDRIIATAAPETVPQHLAEQLKPGGRMVLPIGPAGLFQWLRVYDKDQDGRLHGRETLPVVFVPMIKPAKH